MEGMEYRRCGKSGVLLPEVSLGLWHNFGDGDDPAEGRALVARALELGVCHFDLANNYGPPPGAAEERFGNLLQGEFSAHRDEMFISTKAGYLMWGGPYGDWGSRKYLVASLNQSLRRLKLDYVDVFYHHRPDPETPLEETMQALIDIVHQAGGSVSGIGIAIEKGQQKGGSELRAEGYWVESIAIVESMDWQTQTIKFREQPAKTLEKMNLSTGE